MFSQSIKATIAATTLVMVLSTLSAQAGSRDSGAQAGSRDSGAQAGSRDSGNVSTGQGRIGSMAARGSADSNPTPHPGPVQPTFIVHPEFVINPDSM